MRTVWKFPLVIADRQTITMPREARILTVQMQAGIPMLWALVDSESEPLKTRQIVMAGTGHEIGNEWHHYISTIQVDNGALIFHFFEIED